MNACAYCGRENAADAVNCSGCGSSLISEASPDSERPKKSKAVAVTLALIFGPIGLLYLGGEGLMVVVFIVGITLFAMPLIITGAHYMHGFGLLINLLSRAGSAWWAMTAVDRRNVDPDTAEARTLLDEAVKLESVDSAQAIAKYEELIAKCPHSSASTAAKSCLETLRSHESSALV